MEFIDTLDDLKEEEKRTIENQEMLLHLKSGKSLSFSNYYCKSISETIILQEERDQKIVVIVPSLVYKSLMNGKKLNIWIGILNNGTYVNLEEESLKSICRVKFFDFKTLAFASIHRKEYVLDDDHFIFYISLDMLLHSFTGMRIRIVLVSNHQIIENQILFIHHTRKNQKKHFYHNAASNNSRIYCFLSDIKDNDEFSGIIIWDIMNINNVITVPKNEMKPIFLTVLKKKKKVGYYFDPPKLNSVYMINDISKYSKEFYSLMISFTL